MQHWTDNPNPQNNPQEHVPSRKPRRRQWTTQIPYDLTPVKRNREQRHPRTHPKNLIHKYIPRRDPRHESKRTQGRKHESRDKIPEIRSYEDEKEETVAGNRPAVGWRVTTVMERVEEGCRCEETGPDHCGRVDEPATTDACNAVAKHLGG